MFKWSNPNYQDGKKWEAQTFSENAAVVSKLDAGTHLQYLSLTQLYSK